MTTNQQKIMQAYIETGRIAFFYPRKKLISLNGHKALPIKEAVAEMQALLNRA